MSNIVNKAYADWTKAHKQLIALEQELGGLAPDAQRERESLLIRIRAARERSERLLADATAALRSLDGKPPSKDA